MSKLELEELGNGGFGRRRLRSRQSRFFSSQHVKSQSKIWVRQNEVHQRQKKKHIEDINKGSQGLAVGNTETSKVTRHTSLSKQGKACEVKHETMRNYSNSNKLETKHKVTLLKQKNKTQVPYSLVYTLDKSPVHGGAGWKFSFTLFWLHLLKISCGNF